MLVFVRRSCFAEMVATAFLLDAIWLPAPAHVEQEGLDLQSDMPRA